MSNIKTEKKKKSIGSIIFSIFYFAFIVVVVGAIVMNIGKKDNEMKSFYGINFAVVQTGSMVDGGFDVGDFVCIKEVDASKRKLKDKEFPDKAKHCQCKINVMQHISLRQKHKEYLQHRHFP